MILGENQSYGFVLTFFAVADIFHRKVAQAPLVPTSMEPTRRSLFGRVWPRSPQANFTWAENPVEFSFY